jgi:hypothetical protein
MKKVFGIVFALVLVVGLGLVTTVPVLADSGFTDIVQVAAGYEYTVGLKFNGTVVAVGDNRKGQCNVGGWSNITQVAAGAAHTVGLKSDGTVAAVGDNYYGQRNVGGWMGINETAAGWGHTVGLKSDGTAVAVGYNGTVVEIGVRNYTTGGGQLDVGGWTNISQIAAGWGHTVGLKSDGTVVAVGGNPSGQCSVTGWINITQVSAGAGHTVGLKSDGTVVAVGDNYYDQCNVGSWSGITQVSAGYWYTVGLKSDGTVVAVGDNYQGQRNVGGWTNITQVAAGWRHTAGCRNDGTVVAVGTTVIQTVTNGIVDARAGADTQVVVSGTATVVITSHTSDPHATAGGYAALGSSDLFPMNKWIDIRIDDISQLTEAQIQLYYTNVEVAGAGLDESSLRLSYWNGAAWAQCSLTGVNTAASYPDSGYMWANLTADTTPSLDYLQGSGFAGVGYQGPTQPPTGVCFITTAAYGTDTAKELDILREFRDTVLLPNAFGAKFVSFYYRTSPPVANFISQCEFPRTVVRVGFVDPIVKLLKWTNSLWSARGNY